jgi:hypothetical protein
LKYRPGLSSWKVAGQASGKNADGTQTFFDSYAAAMQQQGEGSEDLFFKEMHETFWPPHNADSLGLEKW